MSLCCRCSVPRLVVVERQTLVAVGSSGIVLAATDQLLLQSLSGALHTLAGVTVTLAPEIQEKQEEI